jgi:hypothetical protein
MKTIEIISQDVFDKIRSRFQNLEMGDENGGVTMDPRMARFFDFDFVINEHNLGRVSISINELGTLKLFYGKSILESADDPTQNLWYNFLKEMRNFAKRRLLRFDTRDITKSNLNKDDFQYLASKGSKEEDMHMNESAKFNGSSKTSYRVLERTKLIVKHKAPVNTEDTGGRTRPSNISAVYVENNEGERFKYPFIHIAGAKAMQRHVANGGRPYDDKGTSIIGMSEQIAQLTAFKRHIGSHDGMNQEVNEISERANMKLESLRNQMHSLGGQKAYEAWCETFDPAAEPVEMDQATMEDYKSKFTVSSFREDLAQYFPLLHSIMQEAGTLDLESFVGENSNEEQCEECDRPVNKCACDKVKEDIFNKFSAWADAVTEGTLEPDSLYELSELLQQPIPIGADGDAGIESLRGIGINNDALEKLIVARAAEQGGENTMLKDVVAEWLMKDDPEAAQELGLTTDVAPDTPVAESPEDRTSYQVARWLFDKGIRYSPENEKHVISLMDDAMRKLGMDNKSIRYNLSYDEDFIPDTLGELQHMEDAINELAEGSRDEDAVLPKMDKGNPPGGMIKQVAEMVKSFYNRNHKEQGLGPFPKGEEGVVIHVRKQLGDEAGDLAERFVSKLSGQADEGWKGQVAGGTVGTLAGGALGAVGGPVGAAFGSALGGALGGVAGDKLGGPEEDEDKPKEGAAMDQIPAYVRKQKQQSQDTAQAATDKRNEKAGAKVWSSNRANEEFESILKLAGLAK